MYYPSKKMTYISFRDTLKQRIEFGKRRKPLTEEHKRKISESLKGKRRGSYVSNPNSPQSSRFDRNLDRAWKATQSLANLTSTVATTAKGIATIANSSDKVYEVGRKFVNIFNPPPIKPETKTDKLMRIFDSSVERVGRTSKALGQTVRAGKGGVGLAKDVLGYETASDKRKAALTAQRMSQMNERLKLAKDNLGLSQDRLNAWKAEVNRRTTQGTTLQATVQSHSNTLNILSKWAGITPKTKAASSPPPKPSPTSPPKRKFFASKPKNSNP